MVVFAQLGIEQLPHLSEPLPKQTPCKGLGIRDQAIRVEEPAAKTPSSLYL